MQPPRSSSISRFKDAACPQVYKEAIANALDAEASEISVSVAFGGTAHAPESLEVVIEDDGVGFTDERFARFARLQDPQDPYHKGLGRMVYLKYFWQVVVESGWDGGSRRFVFSDAFNGADERLDEREVRRGSRLTFRQLRGRLHRYDYVTPAWIKSALLVEFLPQFRERKLQDRPVRIKISVQREEGEQQQTMDDCAVILDASDIPQFRTQALDLSDIDIRTRTPESATVAFAGSSGGGGVVVV
jgi:hypothetical protein